MCCCKKPRDSQEHAYQEYARFGNIQHIPAEEKMDTQTTYAQRELDKIAHAISLHDQIKMVELHAIYCPCALCEARREFERMRRDGRNF